MKKIQIYTIWRNIAAIFIMLQPVLTKAQPNRFNRLYDFYSLMQYVGNGIETQKEQGHLMAGWKAYNPNAPQEYQTTGLPVQTGHLNPWIMHTDMAGLFPPYVPGGPHGFSNVYKFKRLSDEAEISVTSAKIEEDEVNEYYGYIATYQDEYKTVAPEMIYMAVRYDGTLFLHREYSFPSGTTAAEITSIKRFYGSNVNGRYIVTGTFTQAGIKKMFVMLIELDGKIVWRQNFDFTPDPSNSDAEEKPFNTITDPITGNVIVVGTASFGWMTYDYDAFILELDGTNGSVIPGGQHRLNMPSAYGGVDVGSVLTGICQGNVSGGAEYFLSGYVYDVRYMPWFLRISRTNLNTINGSWVYENSANYTGPTTWYSMAMDVEQVWDAEKNDWATILGGNFYDVNLPFDKNSVFYMNVDASTGVSTLQHRPSVAPAGLPGNYLFFKGFSRTLTGSIGGASLYSTPTVYQWWNTPVGSSWPVHRALIDNGLTPGGCNYDHFDVFDMPAIPTPTTFSCSTVSYNNYVILNYKGMYTEQAYEECEQGPYDGTPAFRNGSTMADDNHEFHQLQNTMGISYLKDNKDTKLYPNPTTNSLTIEVTAESDAEVSIMNVQGIKMGCASLGTDKLYHYDATALLPGVYLVQISQGDSKKILRFTKQ